MHRSKKIQEKIKAKIKLYNYKTNNRCISLWVRKREMRIVGRRMRGPMRKCLIRERKE